MFILHNNLYDKGKNMFDKYKNLTPEECAKTIKKKEVASLFFNEATTFFVS